MVQRHQLEEAPPGARVSPCPRCRREVYYLLAMPSGLPVPVNPTPQLGAVVAPPAPGVGGLFGVAEEPGTAMTAGGWPARVGQDVPRDVLVWVLHVPSCTNKRLSGARRVLEDEVPPLRPPVQDTKADRCSRCRRSILWLQTVNGKAVPLDPERHVGAPLTKEQAALLKGCAGVARGYTLRGEALAFLEDPAAARPPADLVAALPPGETFHLTHFASCPFAAGFRR